MKEPIETRKVFLGDKMDAAKIPIYGPTKYGVNFAGKVFELVDHFGKAVHPCIRQGATTNGVQGEIPKVLSLPAKALPQAGIEWLLEGVNSPYSQYYFQSNAAHNNKTRSLRAECSSDGKVLIKESENCVGNHKIQLGSECKSSALQTFKMPWAVQAQGNVGGFVGGMVGGGGHMPYVPLNPSDATGDMRPSGANVLSANASDKKAETTSLSKDSVADLMCQAINADMERFKAKGVKIEAKSLCVNADGCAYYSGSLSFHYPSGACSPAGELCLATPMGGRLIRKRECEATIEKFDQINSCEDSSGKVFRAGECLVPRQPHSSPAGYVIGSPGFYDVDRQTLLFHMHSQVPSFECGSNNESKFSQRCCESNNGVLKNGKTQQNTNFEVSASMDLTEAHRTWMDKLLLTYDRCERKIQKSQDETGLQPYHSPYEASGSHNTQE